MMSRALAIGVAVALAGTAGMAQEPESFKRTDSRRPYAHHLELIDSEGRKFDPRAEGAPPFSIYQTCRTCHDVAKIEHGWHFNAAADPGDAGRPGEPWIWTDERTGTSIPLSFRGWPGTRRPEEVGLDPLRFLQIFGRQLTGGARTYAGADVESGRFRITGDLPIDCMICHSASRSWSHEKWAKTVAEQDFAWAAAIAMGVAKVEGSVRGLPDDLDLTTDEGRAQLPKTTYDPAKIDLDGHVFFDVVRRPTNEACYTCHTVHGVGEDADPRWIRDVDVHLRAGMSCVDCHRHGLEHHTVRGYEGEQHPTGIAVDSLTCRGCHLDQTDGHGAVVSRGGRLGAPMPLHAGLPPVHLDTMSCTSCHSGPLPSARAGQVQTSMAHGLGLPDQLRGPEDLPGIAEPVLRRNAAGVIEPVRMTWPSFWGYEKDDRITPIPPDVAFRNVRRSMRVRERLRPDAHAEKPTAEDFAAVVGAGRAEEPEAEWTPEERETMRRRLAERTEQGFHGRLVTALGAFQKGAPEGAVAVAVSAGKVYRLDGSGEALAIGTHPDAEPYVWPLAHDVRPARMSTGANGCPDCHSPQSPFVHGTVTALGPAPDTTPRTTSMLELMDLDPTLTAAWEQSFRGRDAFKVVGVIAAAILTLVVLLQLFVGLDAVVRVLGRRRGKEEAS